MISGGALAVLAENRNFIPRTHVGQLTTAYKSSPRRLVALSGLCRHLYLHAHALLYTCTHNEKFKK